MRRGISAIELVIATLIGGIVIGGVLYTLSKATRLRETVLEKGEVDSDVLLLAEHLLRVGKTARFCSALGSTLTCQVDFNVPPTGATSTIIFGFSDSASALWEKMLPQSFFSLAFAETVNLPPPLPPPSLSPPGTAPPPPPPPNASDFDKKTPLVGKKFYYRENRGGAWATKRVYRHIANVEFCSDAHMSVDACPIQSNQITQRHLSNQANDVPPDHRTEQGKFFRFRITGLSQESETLDQGRRIQVQGAFYLRNPTGVDELYFQWGG